MKKVLRKISPDILIDFRELKKEKSIGKGNFGKVYRAVYQGEDVALKRMYADQKISAKYIMREIRLLRSLNHPNIVR